MKANFIDLSDLVMEQKENLLQISPVPHRSKFFNFLFQIVKWGNFAETLVYNTLCFTFASPEIKKNRVRPHCAVIAITDTVKLKISNLLDKISKNFAQ